MKILIIISLLFVGFYSKSQVRFVSAAPYSVEVIQPDGTKINIRGVGDEFNHYSVTEDGFTILKNQEGFFEFARKNKIGKLELSGFRVKNKEERNTTERNFLTTISTYLQSSETNVVSKVSGGDDPQLVFPNSGSRKVLLLLIQYPDLGNTYSGSSFDNMMNQSNYGGNGSFRDYYLQASGGDLSLSVDVFGWYTAANNYEYYGDDNGYNVSRELVQEAVDAAEAAGVDFSQYDNDNDGEVDDLMVVHSGPGAEEGSKSEYIWSHSTTLGFFYKRIYDGVTINSYVINPETRSYGMVGIGVFCHEFGHALGLPDLYDTDTSNGDSEGLGNWCLMAGGGWLNNEKTPAMLSAWTRENLGWISPTVISSNGDYSLTPAATGTQCYKITTSKSNEYFLLENRYKTGFDTALPGSGLAIFHINSNKLDNGDNDDENDKLSDLEEADGLNQLDNTSNNRGDEGDVFPGSTNNVTFNDLTNPDAKNNDGTLTGIDIQDIQLDGSTVRFRIGSVIEPFKDLTYNLASNNLTINKTQVDINLRVKNDGNENAGAFKVGFYLSDNSNVTTSDYFIGSENLASLNAGSYANISFSKDVSEIVPEIPEGIYYVSYIIDFEDNITESEEGNNTYLFSSPKVEIFKKPNLTFLSNKNSLNINGYNVSVELEVINNGNKLSNSSKIGIYVSERNSIQTSDYLLGEISLESLNPNESSFKTFSANVIDKIPFLPLGFYYVGYYIDNVYYVIESNETDNVYTSTTQTIDNDLYPNLTYARGNNNLEITSSRLNFGMKLTNNGEISSTETKVNFYLSENENISASDVFLGSKTITGVDINEEVPVSVTYEIENLENQISEGYYYLGYLIDTEERIEELDERDNDFTYAEKFHYCPPDVTQIFETICEGEGFSYRDTIYKTEGVFEYIYQNQAGCDSVIVLDIQVNPTHFTNLNETICRGQSITIGNQEYTETGVYTQVFTNQYGCDSTVTLNLDVIEPVVVHLSEEICEGEFVEVAGNNYSSSGIFENTIQRQSGCDSTIILNLTVNPHSDTLLSKEICEGEYYQVGNSAYNQTGQYTDLLVNRFGCDSLVTLDLLVNPVQEVIIDEVICSGDSVNIGSFSYFETGTFTNVFPNQFGCDSTVILNLTVNPVNDTLLQVVLCEGETYKVGDSIFDTGGVSEMLLKNRFGCDSLVTLDLIVNPVHETVLSKIICEGENIQVGTSVYTETGDYIDVLSNQFGCDSTVYLNLTVNPVHEVDVFEDICEGTSYLFGGTAFTSSGEYDYTFSNQFGCDSIVTLHLNVVPLPFIDLGEDFIMYGSESKILDAGFGFSTYLWNTGETSQTITIDKSIGFGEKAYTVLVGDEYSCSSSDEIKITIYDDLVSEGDKEPLLKIFPNPNNGDMNLLIEEITGIYQLRVFTKSGSMIYSNEFTSTESKFIQHLNLPFLLPGIYTVQIISSEKVLVERFVKGQ